MNDNIADYIDCKDLQNDRVRCFFREPIYVEFQSLGEQYSINQVDQSHDVLVNGWYEDQKRHICQSAAG